jgi:hypothetical protein
MKKISLLFTYVLLSLSCVSQQVRNVGFFQKANTLVVSYDLVNCPKKEIYDIRLNVFLNGEQVPVYTTSGDLKNVTEGRNRKIVWDVLNDTELKGNVQVEVEVTNTRSTKIIGGPSNVFLSMLLPGLGHAVDNNKQGAGTVVALSFLGSAVVAAYCKQESDKLYKTYLQETEQSKIDEAYNNANTQYQLSQFWAGLAGAIWLTDVIYVTVQGFSNRARQKRLMYSQNDTKVRLFMSSTLNNFQLGIIKRF